LSLAQSAQQGDVQGFGIHVLGEIEPLGSIAAAPKIGGIKLEAD